MRPRNNNRNPPYPSYLVLKAALNEKVIIRKRQGLWIIVHPTGLIQWASSWRNALDTARKGSLPAS